MKPFFHRLNRLWRAAMTGFCFALFGIGGLLLSLIWFNLLLVLVRNKTADAVSRGAAFPLAFAYSSAW